MYIIRESELLSVKAEPGYVKQQSQPILSRLGRRIADRFQVRANRRVAQAVIGSQHPGVIADFAAGCGDD